MKLFLLKLFSFSLLIAAGNYCWESFLPIKNHVPHVWPILSFFVFVTAIFHFITIKAARGRPQNFIRYYMGITAAKLFLYIGIIFIYRCIDKPTVIPFALGFLAHYFLFTIFEVVLLLKELRK